MKKKIVTFGEIMLRLTTPDNLRIQQSRDFLVNYGGSEANVAISAANFGGEVEFITRLPENALGDTCLAELRSHNIGTKHILIGGKRLGTYYMEKAAAMRNSKVIYDRESSAFSELKPGMINWRDAFKDAAIFHWSGIDAALTPGLADVCKERVPAENDAIQQQLATFVKPFKTSINYAFDNYLLNRTLPHNYLQGWLYADSGSGGEDTFDTHKDVKDAAATPIILAMLVQYENNHGTL